MNGHLGCFRSGAIMNYAAELLGKTGLRYTLAEIATIVQNFDCGVYFTREFIENNLDAVITLELKVFTQEEDINGNLVDDANGNPVLDEDISISTHVFRFGRIVAAIFSEGKQTHYFTSLYDALHYPKYERDEIVTILR